MFPNWPANLVKVIERHWIASWMCVLASACSTDGGRSLETAGASAGGTAPQIVSCLVEEAAEQRSARENSCHVEHPGSGDRVELYGDVLAGAIEYKNGMVAINGTGMISYVGCPVTQVTEAKLPRTRIACPGAVISPGLINAHDHVRYDHLTPQSAYLGKALYKHRNEWRFGLGDLPEIPDPGPGTVAQTSWSELRQVISGTTSIAGAGGVRGLLRNLDTFDMQEFKDPFEPRKRTVRYVTFPLGRERENYSDNGCEKYSLFLDSSTVLADYSVFLPHVAEGTNAFASNEFDCLAGGRPGAPDLLAKNTTLVHAVGLKPEQEKLVAARGASIVWSPRSELALYGRTALVDHLADLGVNLALGSDWTLTGSASLLRELKCAASYNRAYLHSRFSSFDLWNMVTANAADALNVGERLGRIKAGLHADIAIFAALSSKDSYQSIVDARVDNVMLVLRDGIPLFGQSDIVQALAPNLQCESVPWQRGGQSVCLKSEIGLTLEELRSQVGSAYPIYFPEDTPPNEPVCLPMKGAN